jgi:hypothetical protein
LKLNGGNPTVCTGKASANNQIRTVLVPANAMKSPSKQHEEKAVKSTVAGKENCLQTMYKAAVL